MSDYLCHIPTGDPIPFGNPHAVSVSLPKIQDVVDYEEGRPEMIAKMKSGYPRFFQNPFVKHLTAFVREKYGVEEERILIPITSIKAKNIIEKALDVTFDYIEDECKNVFLVIASEDTDTKRYADFIRNAGLIISSRKAEASLLHYNVVDCLFPEENLSSEQAIYNIHHVLGNAYGTSEDNIILTNSGMNALYAATEAIVCCQKNLGKTRIVQLGWLYIDTMEIIERSENAHVQVNVFDLDQLENWLDKNHKNVAVLVTEVVTNPLLQCVDLPRLYELCSRFNVKLIVDNTIATPYCVDVLPYCDIVVESLTKFACGNADLLFGAIVQKQSNWTSQIHNYVISPFDGEIKRLGLEILGYEDRVKKVSENTLLLYDYLKSSSKIVAIKSALHEDSLGSLSKIQKGNLVPGLLSIVFDADFIQYYDALPLAKGPSLGTEFTLAMPYVYLAHYDYLKSEKGLDKLKDLGISPNLLRISVGAEPIDEIIKTFQSVLERTMISI
jgi:cystathionine gamma-synthase